MKWLLQLLGGWYVEVIGMMGALLFWLAAYRMGNFESDEDREGWMRAAGMAGILFFFILLAHFLQYRGFK